MVTKLSYLRIPGTTFLQNNSVHKNQPLIYSPSDAVGSCQGNALTNATGSSVLCSHILPLLQAEKSFCSSVIDFCAAYWRPAPFKFWTLLKSIALLVLSYKTSQRHFNEKFKGAKNNNKSNSFIHIILSYLSDKFDLLYDLFLNLCCKPSLLIATDFHPDWFGFYPEPPLLVSFPLKYTGILTKGSRQLFMDISLLPCKILALEEVLLFLLIFALWNLFPHISFLPVHTLLFQ